MTEKREHEIIIVWKRLKKPQTRNNKINKNRSCTDGGATSVMLRVRNMTVPHQFLGQG